MRIICAVCKSLARTYQNVIWDERLDENGEEFVDDKSWMCGKCYGGMRKRAKNLMGVIDGLNADKAEMNKVINRYKKDPLHSAVDNVFNRFM